MTSETPRTHPDVVAKEMLQVAQKHDYGVTVLELSWLTGITGTPVMKLRYSAMDESK
jgi:hypothetical protein